MVVCIYCYNIIHLVTLPSVLYIYTVREILKPLIALDAAAWHGP